MSNRWLLGLAVIISVSYIDKARCTTLENVLKSVLSVTDLGQDSSSQEELTKKAHEQSKFVAEKHNKEMEEEEKADEKFFENIYLQLKAINKGKASIYHIA